MGDILFVTWDGGGNVPPAIGIASELQRRGESVRVLGHEQQRTMIEKAGLRFEPYSHPHPFSSTTPEPWLRWITSSTPSSTTGALESTCWHPCSASRPT